MEARARTFAAFGREKPGLEPGSPAELFQLDCQNQGPKEVPDEINITTN